MLLRFILGAGIAIGVTLFTGPPAAADEQVGRLIAQLGSKQFAEREAASAALDALGEPALASLRKARTSEDAEISRRAEGLVARIERRVESARLLEPKRVRLVYQEARVLEALADAARQTGLPLEFEGDRTPLSRRTLTLDTGDVSVWEALDQFKQAAGLAERLTPANNIRNGTKTTVEVQNGMIIQRQILISSSYLDARSLHDTRIVLVEGKSSALPTHQVGAVRVRAVPGPNPAPPGLRQPGEVLFNLEVTPQPGLPWQGVLDVRVHRAVDEHGQELTQPAGTGATPYLSEVAWARNGAVFFADTGLMEPSFANRVLPVRLQAGKKPAKTLREVEGVVTAQTEVGPEALITVDNVYQAAGRTWTAEDGTTLKIVDATRGDDGKVQVRAELQTAAVLQVGGVLVGRVGRRPVNGRGPANAREVEAAALPLTLLDGAGQRVPLQSVKSAQDVNGFGMPHELVLTFEPKAGQADAVKLIYTGKRTVLLDIPFTLKEVPLP